jgi:hypothetical protein
VSLAAPANGATVSGIVSVSAKASSSIGIASVQFLADGVNVGPPVTSSPYVYPLDSTQLSNGNHTLAAMAKDTNGSTTTSASVTVTVSNAVTLPPPPPSASDTVTINDTSGSAQVNRPVSVSRAFAQGEIKNFVLASIGSTSLVTQTDVKNRWPDGSVKFAVVSFVVPNLPANGSVTVALSSQTSGNNTGYLQKADMLGAAYNFDAQIKVTNGPTVSARRILNDCASIVDPGTDPSAPQAQPCRYWLKGPVVTAVIFEDRNTTRAYDFDAGDTSKALHPIFECWFYTTGSYVNCGYSVENTWISSSNAQDMRDETWGFTLTGGNTSPTSFFTQASYKQIGGSRWHKQFCVNGAGSGPLNQCGPSIRIDHNFNYVVSTGAVPYYDPSVTISPSLLTSLSNSWVGANHSIQGTDNSGGNGSLGNYSKALGSAGQANWIGPDQLWSVAYLHSYDDRLLAAMIGNDDLVGWFPWHAREADLNAGSGQHFDAPSTGTVATNGRVLSINARQAIDSSDYGFNAANCGNFAPDTIRVGSISNDGINGENIDPSHTPASGYTSYLFTGQFYYLEEMQMHASWEMAYGPGCDSSPGSGSSRQFSMGVPQGNDNIGGPRGPAWWMRMVGEAAFLSPDNSPERAYFEDKLLNAIASDEGAHNVAQSNPARSTAYNFGKNSRLPKGNGNGTCGSSLGASPLGWWWCGNAGQVDSSLTAKVADATKPWMENFYICALGMLRDFGYTTDNVLNFMANRQFNLDLNSSVDHFLVAQYTVPGMNTSGAWIPTWAAFSSTTYFTSLPTGWANQSSSWDNSYQAIAYGASSYLYPYTATDGSGFTGVSNWAWIKANIPNQALFATVSPKFGIVPRTRAAGGSPAPNVSITAPTNGSALTGSVSVTATATGSAAIVSVQLFLDGANLGSQLTTAPYSVAWNTANAANGNHLLTATATDTTGTAAASAAVGVTVNNAIVAPVITAVTANPTPTGAVILWTTSTPSTSKAFYGTTTAYGQSTSLDSTVVTSHTVILTGLASSTVYNFQVQSQDSSGNTTTSGNFTFATTGASGGGGIPPTLGWYNIPNTTLQAVCPSVSGYPAIQATTGCESVIETWSGATLDTKRNRLWIWGGGHNNYLGNEVYALDLNSKAMLRLNNPSPVDNVSSCPDAYVDGAPSSRHTYDSLAYIPSADVMFAFGGSKSICGYFSQGTWTLNLSTLQWKQMNPTGTIPSGGPGQIAQYDPNTGLVFFHDYQGGLYTYNHNTNSWSQVLPDTYGIDYHATGVIDPKRKLFMVVGGNASPYVRVYTIGGTYAKSTPNVDSSCSAAITNQSSPGVTYDPVLDKTVIWPNFGNTVYLMDDTTWTCTTATYAGGPPNSHHVGSSNGTWGTFGRFQYVPSLGIYVVVNDWDINGYTLRLTP